jgi:WD40 repeat protein
MGPMFLLGGQGLAGWTYSDGRVTLCDLPSGKVRADWPAHRHTIEGLAVSRDGRFLASIGDDGMARVWSTADQSEVAPCVGHKGAIHSVAFSPDGTRLVTGGKDDSSIHIWELPEICRVVE